MMKNVVILNYTKPGKFSSRPKEDTKYQYRRDAFFLQAKEAGVNLYRASFRAYDAKRNVFTHAWTYDGIWKEFKDIKPHFIDDRAKVRPDSLVVKEKLAAKVPYMNNPLMNRYLGDKYLNYELFKKWSPRTYLIGSREQLLKKLEVLSEEKFVLKPLGKSQGRGIVIGSQEEIEAGYNGGTVILQEYLETQGGIPGILKGRHDLRVVVLENQPLYAYARIPREGQLVANVSKGGSIRYIALDELPDTLDPIFKRAKELFEPFSPCIYSVDFMFHDGKPYVCELNSTPGMLFTSEHKELMRRVFARIIDTYKNHIVK